jgi:hypothetical protein
MINKTIIYNRSMQYRAELNELREIERLDHGKREVKRISF